jgi:hypothetical protein
MTHLTAASPDAEGAAVRSILEHFSAQTSITRAQINAAMSAGFGGTDADGRWTQRESFELLELALVTHLRGQQCPPSSESLLSAIALAARMPTHTVRSETQVEWQQFSTPVDLATLATWLASPQPTDVVLEPSAGNGLLAAQLGTVSALHLNEIDPDRRRRLVRAFPDAVVTGVDGASIASLPGGAPRPTLIMMNPPFSRSLGRGADDYAAVRHLQAALRHLLPGGRIVAIMPDWFGPSARMRDLFETTLRDVTIRTSLRLERCYTRHGTSITVRLFVIDKVAGGSVPQTLQRSDVQDLLDLVPAPRCTVTEQVAAKPAKGGRGISLFRAARSSRPAAPRPFYAPTRNDVLPIAYTVLEAPAPLAEQAGVYLPYRPSRIAFGNAGEHPTALVESVAMGSIPAPRPRHVPRLPERTVSERLLSSSQLETVIYAGDAWAQMLPGCFLPAKEGVGLEVSDDGRPYRKGFYLGDGIGAGKGRQIAACILDNWLAGRRRHIWVTKNEPLLEDARRDWTALGGLAADIQPLTAWKIDEPVRLDQGVIFVTYPTLRSARSENSRLQQLLDWAGEAFDGVIAFDEAHEMGGVAGGEGALGAKKGSQQGICGVLLQNNLPGARILYASATGASDINNLAYAVRLGLWGPETAFPDREQFISGIRKGGIAAMELVARDLKATGLYTARALSFAGVEYDILRHSLTPEQTAIYGLYAEAWAILCAARHKIAQASASGNAEEAVMRRNAA